MFLMNEGAETSVRDIPRNFPGEQQQRHGGPVPPYDTLQQTQRGLYEKMGTFQSDGESASA